MSKFEINEYQPATKANPYAEHVAALIEAGEGKTITITVPEADENKNRLAFQRAANDADKTARVVSLTTEDGKSRIEFILKPREKRAKVVNEATD